MSSSMSANSADPFEVEYTGYLDFWFTDFPYRNIARKLHELKFDGFVGMEFAPTGSESAAFRSVQEIIQ